jgi:predicted DNA-binding transcriptional regulator AlpA
MMYSLLDLLHDPAQVAGVPPQAISPLLCQLAALQSALAARLLMESAVSSDSLAEADVLLNVTEASERLGTSPDWLYRHAHQLPFTVRVGPRQLRFSAHGLAQYIRKRQGR